MYGLSGTESGETAQGHFLPFPGLTSSFAGCIRHKASGRACFHGLRETLTGVSYSETYALCFGAGVSFCCRRACIRFFVKLSVSA
jgi:hypothetical protein